MATPTATHSKVDGHYGYLYSQERELRNTSDSSAESEDEHINGQKSGPWKSSEDALLVKVVNKYGAKKWSKVASEVPGRNGKSCRLRWCNQLSPRINRTAFTEWEDAVIVRGQEDFGKRWALISKMLVGRTDNAVKNRWNGLFCRRLNAVIRGNKFLSCGTPLKAVLKLGPQTLQGDSLQMSENMDSGRSQDSVCRASASARAREMEETSGSYQYATAEEMLDGRTGPSSQSSKGNYSGKFLQEFSWRCSSSAGAGPLPAPWGHFGWVPATPWAPDTELASMFSIGDSDSFRPTDQ